VHTQSPTATIDTLWPRSTTTSRTAPRTGSTLLVGGLAAEYVMTSFHPAHMNPNDHHARLHRIRSPRQLDRRAPLSVRRRPGQHDRPATRTEPDP